MYNQESALPSNTGSPIRWGIGVLIVGFGGFLLWASFAPLDEGVPAQGMVSIDTKRKTIQHLTGGIVKDVQVKEGQQVKEGDLLLVLDDVNAKARYEEVRQKYIGDLALRSRLATEQSGAKTIAFHSDLQKLQHDPLAKNYMRNQTMLLSSRRGALNADLSATEESIHGQEALIAGYTNILKSRQSQLKLLNEQLSGVRDLAREGYAPMTQQKDLEIKVAQTTGDIADTESNLLKARHTIAELKQHNLLRTDEYKRDVDTDMTKVTVDVESNVEKLRSLKNEFGRTEIRSPVAGQVIGLQFQTIGSVIQPGQKILDVVPSNEELLLEAKIPPNLIDRVYPGQDADIRFSSFANSPMLQVDGHVESVSKDLLTDPSLNPAQPGASYFLARISVTKKGIKTLQGRILQSGMPVQVIVKTGERTLLTYLMHPLMKRISASLKEE
jgi:protease secretion system membrane fusion protein